VITEVKFILYIDLSLLKSPILKCLRGGGTGGTEKREEKVNYSDISNLDLNGAGKNSYLSLKAITEYENNSILTLSYSDLSLFLHSVGATFI
jgi:hypothetical protein